MSCTVIVLNPSAALPSADLKPYLIDCVLSSLPSSPVPCPLPLQTFKPYQTLNYSHSHSNSNSSPGLLVTSQQPASLLQFLSALCFAVI